VKPGSRLLKIERTARSYGRRTKEYSGYFEDDAPPSFADGSPFGGMGPRRFGPMSRFSIPC